MPTDLLIIGAGGHAKVVIEAIQYENIGYRLTVADQDERKQGATLMGRFPITYFDDWAPLPREIHIAIGDNRTRWELGQLARENGKQLISVIHPDAVVSPSSSVEGGCFVAANAVIAADAQILEACIVNHGSVIDHDCFIDGYSHIGPNATLGGGVHVGHGCLIGSGATVLPGIRVGTNVVVGAGSVVTADVKDNQTVVGVPAKGI